MSEFQQALGATNLITVSSGAFTRVVALSNCQGVSVGEDPSVVGYPTTDFLIAKPTSASNPRRQQGGSSYKFVPPFGLFKIGQTVGFVKTVNGSTTFFQDES